jgi:lipoprotein signal peptidase
LNGFLDQIVSFQCRDAADKWKHCHSIADMLFLYLYATPCLNYPLAYPILLINAIGNQADRLILFIVIKMHL